MTITRIRSSTSSYAIAGEFVTSVRSVAGSLTSCRASARHDEDESRKIVEPERTSRAACAAIVAFAPRLTAARCSQPVGGIAVGGPTPGSARAPPCTRSTSPSRESCSRSRWTVIEETVRSFARSATDTPPSRWMRSRICCAAQGWRRRAQTRSSNARRCTCTSSGRNSSIARTRWPAKRVSASSPFSAVARIGLPITPVRENSAWSIGNEKYW